MSTLDGLPPGVRRHGPDDLDSWLRDFFRAEMPAPWPTLVPPAESAPRRRSRPRGRYALAASLLLLLSGHLYLADRFATDEAAPDGSPGRIEATRHKLNGQPRGVRPAPPRLPVEEEGGNGPRDSALKHAPRLPR